MRKDKFGLFCVFMAAMLIFSGWAIGMDDDDGDGGGAKKKPAKKAPPPLEELTLTGTLSKTERTGKDDKVTVTYTLTDANGAKIRVPQPRKPRAKKGEQAPAVIDLEDFVDQQVVIEGKGRTTERGGKQSVTLVSVTSVKAMDGDAPAADNDAEGDMGGDDMW